MQIKERHRLSEEISVPDEWSISTVGREFDVQLGKMLDAAKNSGIPKPYLGNRAVQWGKIDIQDLPTIQMTQNELARFRLQKGDLLVCEGGEVGRAAIWTAPIDECFYQKALHRLRSIRGFSAQLMVYVLKHWCETGFLNNFVSQTSIAHLTREKLLEIPLSVPPPAEQQAIVSALSNMDALIESLDRLIAKKQNIKQATIQQLLTGKKRLPNFGTDGASCQQTELGLIPADWSVLPLGQVGRVIRGSSPRPKGDKRYYGGTIPRLMVEDVTRDGKVVIPSVDFLTDAGAAMSRPCKRGTLTIVCSGTVGVPSILGVDACIHDGFLALVNVGKAFSIEYLYYQLSSLREKFDSSATHGGIFTNLTTTILRQFKVAFPLLEEQQAIAQVLSDMDEELSALEQRGAKIRLLKQGLMQQLLTGRLRLV